MVEGIGWKGPVFAISAVTGEGCEALMRRIQERLDKMLAAEAEADAAPEVPGQIDDETH